MSIGRIRPLIALTGLVALVLMWMVVRGGTIVSGESVTPVGSWYGYATADQPGPLPSVIMMPTFLQDGNVIANDAHELTNPHTTAHGTWQRTGARGMKATFIWINLTDDATAGGFAGNFKVRLSGQIDPSDPNEMKGTLSPVLFPPGTDPLDPDDTGGLPLGTFTIQKLTRIKAQ